MTTPCLPNGIMMAIALGALSAGASLHAANAVDVTIEAADTELTVGQTSRIGTRTGIGKVR